MKKPLILVAASGLAREVMVAVKTGSAYDIAGVVDDNVAIHGTLIDGVPILGGIEVALDHPGADLVVCAGSGRSRERVVGRLADMGVENERFGAVIDSSAVVPGNCLIGAGTVLLARVVLTADVTVGEHVVVMPGVVMTHDDMVGDFATLCAGVVLGGDVHVGARAFLGMNSSVRQNVRVGRDSTLGMGSALVCDLPETQTWAGVPARPLKARYGAPREAANGREERADRPSADRLIERTRT